MPNNHGPDSSGPGPDHPPAQAPPPGSYQLPVSEPVVARFALPIAQPGEESPTQSIVMSQCIRLRAVNGRVLCEIQTAAPCIVPRYGKVSLWFTPRPDDADGDPAKLPPVPPAPAPTTATPEPPQQPTQIITPPANLRPVPKAMVGNSAVTLNRNNALTRFVRKAPIYIGRALATAASVMRAVAGERDPKGMPYELLDTQGSLAQCRKLAQQEAAEANMAEGGARVQTSAVLSGARPIKPRAPFRRFHAKGAPRQCRLNITTPAMSTSQPRSTSTPSAPSAMTATSRPTAVNAPAAKPSDAVSASAATRRPETPASDSALSALNELHGSAMVEGAKSAAPSTSPPSPTSADEVLPLVERRRFLLGLPPVGPSCPPTAEEIQIAWDRREVYARVNLPQARSDPHPTSTTTPRLAGTDGPVAASVSSPLATPGIGAGVEEPAGPGGGDGSPLSPPALPDRVKMDASAATVLPRTMTPRGPGRRRDVAGQMVLLWPGYQEMGLTDPAAILANPDVAQAIVVCRKWNVTNAEELVLSFGPDVPHQAATHMTRTARRRQYRDPAAAFAAYIRKSVNYWPEQYRRELQTVDRN